MRAYKGWRVILYEPFLRRGLEHVITYWKFITRLLREGIECFVVTKPVDAYIRGLANGNLRVALGIGSCIIAWPQEDLMSLSGEEVPFFELARDVWFDGIKLKPCCIGTNSEKLSSILNSIGIRSEPSNAKILIREQSESMTRIRGIIKADNPLDIRVFHLRFQEEEVLIPEHVEPIINSHSRYYQVLASLNGRPLIVEDLEHKRTLFLCSALTSERLTISCIHAAIYHMSETSLIPT